MYEIICITYVQFKRIFRFKLYLKVYGFQPIFQKYNWKEIVDQLLLPNRFLFIYLFIYFNNRNMYEESTF